jgi:hypothetical protein
LRAYNSSTGWGGGAYIGGGPDTGRDGGGACVLAIDAKGTSTFGGDTGGLTDLGASGSGVKGGSLGLLILACPKDSMAAACTVAPICGSSAWANDDEDDTWS